jgi:hypothetical protein
VISIQHSPNLTLLAHLPHSYPHGQQGSSVSAGACNGQGGVGRWNLPRCMGGELAGGRGWAVD